ncbi:MAG: cation:proton antiporter regulatory subunit [Acidimicrobiales bacterium]
MTEVTETQLPGVGVRYEFTTESGDLLGVLSHRSGRREILVYDRGDPDACTTVLRLSAGDTRALAEVLGASHVSESVAAMQRIEGLALDWARVPDGAAVVGTTIGAGRFRTRTGSTIVAVLRGDTTIAAPGPEFTFEAGDVAVAVGTAEGLVPLRKLLAL